MSPENHQRLASLVMKSACALTLAAFAWPFALFVSGQPTPSDFIPPDVTLPEPGAPSAIPSSPAAAAGTPAGGGEFFQPKGRPFAGGSAQSHSGQPGPLPGYSGAGQAMPAAGNNGQPSQASAKRDPIAIIQTAKGPITVRLFRKYAPLTVAHFSEIAGTGFYNGLTFHRVVPGQLIQGGCPNGNGSGFYTDPKTKQPKFIGVELSPNLKHNAAGVVGLARVGRSPMSASSQFYITLSPQSSLDGSFTIFGGVISGMDVVSQIQQGDKILSVTIQDQP